VTLTAIGRPPVIAFGMRAVGFDVVADKVSRRCADTDRAHQMPDGDLTRAMDVKGTSAPEAVREADFVLVAVVTPLEQTHLSEFGPPPGYDPAAGAAAGVCVRAR